MPDKKLYSFENFTFDLEKNILFQNEKPLSITPKVLLLLKVLIENRGEIVEKDELMKSVWGDTFVEESNITYCIRQLRKVFKDDIHSPGFIETVPRRGYRFIAEVDVKEKKQSVPKEGNQPIRFENPVAKKRGYSGIGLGVSLALLFLFFASILSGNSFIFKKPVIPILANKFQTKTLASINTETRAAISPNGKYVAYIYGNNQKESLWLKNLETGNNVELISPSENKYFGIVFSQDNEEIYFGRRDVFENKAETLKIPLIGGTPVKILEGAQGWLSFSPDNRRLAYILYRTGENENCSLWIADKDGKNPRKLVSRGAGLDITDNAWSPDGKKIIFANGHANNASRDYSVSEVDLETGVERDIFKDKFFHIKSLKTLNDDESFLIAGVETIDTPSKIWHVSRKTGEYFPLSDSSDNYKQISLTKEQDKMTAVAYKNTDSLNVYDLKNTNSPQVLTEAGSFNVAPNGNILYSSDVSGNGEIWMMSADGSEQKQLTFEESRDFAPVYSSDERFIFFASNRSSAYQVWRMNADGSNQIQITKKIGGFPISADQNYLYYQSAVDKKLLKIPFDGSSEETIVLDISSPILAVSRDKTKVVTADKNKLIMLSVVDNRKIASLQLENNSNVHSIIWTQDDLSLIFIKHDTTTDNASFWKWEPNSNQTKQILDLGKKGAISYFSFWVSPDENKLMVIRREPKQEILLVSGLS